MISNMSNTQLAKELTALRIAVEPVINPMFRTLLFEAEARLYSNMKPSLNPTKEKNRTKSKNSRMQKYL